MMINVLYFCLLAFIFSVQVKAIQTTSKDKEFGDIGEEHDLDDLIDKRFSIENVTKEESETDRPAVNSTVVADTTTLIGDVMPMKKMDIVFTKNDTVADSLAEVSDDDFEHEITMKSMDSAKERSLITVANVTEDDSSSNNEETSSVLDQGSAFSGSGEEVMNPENPISQYLESGSIEQTEKHNLKYKPMTDKEIQALSMLNKILDPAHAYILNSTHPSGYDEEHYKKQIAKEKAVWFAKLLRGGNEPTSFPKLARKRDFIPSFHKLKQRIFKPMEHLMNFKRNTITIPFRNTPFLLDKRNKILKPPNLREIFKRDRIQIHQNLKKLAEKHKENTLLNDLSQITKEWTGYKDNQANKNPVWMNFLKRAMEPRLGENGDMGVKERIRAQMTPNRQLLGYLFKTNSPGWRSGNNAFSKKGDKIYRKIGSMYIKPYEIEQHLKAKKKQFSSYHPYKPVLKAFTYTPDNLIPSQQTYLQPGSQLTSQYIQPGSQLTSQYIQPASSPPVASIHGNKLNGITKCLPENARCDTGRDEQCCGAASFCVDYWGVGKCLAFKNTSYSDHTNPYKMANNLNYKNYYNAMLGQVKNDIVANGYQKNVGDILKAASLSR